MLDQLADPVKRCVGTKQVIRAIESGQAVCVFIAGDADSHIRQRVRNACADADLEPVEVDSMQELGQACHIQVGAATACVLR